MSDDVWPDHVVYALTAERVEALDEIRTSAAEFDDLTREATTRQWLLTALRGDAELYKFRASVRSDEKWVVATAQSPDTWWVVDQVPDIDDARAAEAIFYPELHSRLVGWWLTHAWRTVDLIGDGIAALRTWRITVAPVLVRALIEVTGCLLYESRRIAAGWAEAKQGTRPRQPGDVRGLLSPHLFEFQYGSRTETHGKDLLATSVLTYVDKLSKIASAGAVRNWYDWLSDAAHPALGATMAVSTNPMVHRSGAVSEMFLSRSVLRLDQGRQTLSMHTPIADYCADAILVCGRIGLDLLRDSLAVIDDFGLTTRSSELTEREYWRKLAPSRGNRQCACGRGSWASCRHRWGAEAPRLAVLGD